MGYLTQKGFFDTIPKAIDEAARIDGATNFQVFMKINPAALPADHRLYCALFFYLAVERLYSAEAFAEGKEPVYGGGRSDEPR